MQSFVIYILVAVLAGGAVAWAATWNAAEVEEFYGFAETAETEINFNYDVEVEEIMVQAGSSVDSGDVLMRVRRAREKERISDQPYRIDELRAEQRLSDAQLVDRAERLEAEYTSDRAALVAKRNEIEQEARFRNELLEAIDSPTGDQTPTQGYRPLDAQLTSIEAELTLLDDTYRRRTLAIERERALARGPITARVDRLDAEAQFDEAQGDQVFEIKAPGTGVIGSVNAKIAEHKSSFSPLVIFYEPHATQVKAYIHEDRILDASVGDSVRVSALSNPSLSIGGSIAGLGSRIVEIPPRLRRLSDLKTYGREVQVTIPANNPFLQKEKVELTFQTRDDE